MSPALQGLDVHLITAQLSGTTASFLLLAWEEFDWVYTNRQVRGTWYQGTRVTPQLFLVLHVECSIENRFGRVSIENPVVVRFVELDRISVRRYGTEAFVRLNTEATPTFVWLQIGAFVGSKRSRWSGPDWHPCLAG
jgi:hypothetical protein